VRLGDGLQHTRDVFHIVEIYDCVVDRADDFHSVILQYLAAAQLGHRLVVFQLRKHCLYVAVRLEQPAARTRSLNLIIFISLSRWYICGYRLAY